MFYKISTAIALVISLGVVSLGNYNPVMSISTSDAVVILPTKEEAAQKMADSARKAQIAQSIQAAKIAKVVKFIEQSKKTRAAQARANRKRAEARRAKIKRQKELAKKKAAQKKAQALLAKKRAKEYKKDKIIKVAKTYLGVRYRFGGESRKGIDCSSFTQKVMLKLSVKLPRTAAEQIREGKRISKNKIKKGDLIFFKNTDHRHTVSHVGIYLGGGRFIHASSAAHRVTITRFTGFYKRHFAGARRYT